MQSIKLDLLTSSLLFLFFCCTLSLSAQKADMPRPSPKASLGQTIGVTDINVHYGRPAAKGRKLFGHLIPFGEVWRTGANEATTIKTEQNHIGSCGIYLKGEAAQEATIGYIMHPKYWNQGYTSEAIPSLINFGYHNLSIKKIKATCDTRNIASKRVLEKCGFEWVETIKDHYEQKGVMRASFVFVHTTI